MLSIIRKSAWFKHTQKLKYDRAFEASSKIKEELKENLEAESKIEEILAEYEKEMKELELKYDVKVQEMFKKRRENIKAKKDTTLNCFWLNALSNHKLFKDFINQQDIQALKFLEDISYSKCNDGNSIKLQFTFSKNEFFSNEVLEKHYKVNDEHLVEEITSTEINWLKRNLAFENVDKKMKNKKTGEVETRKIEQPKNTFFNFFATVKLPDEATVDKLDFENEKELAQYLDTEFEYVMEFVEEFIPHATDYFLGFKTENEEYTKYMEAQHKK